MSTPKKTTTPATEAVPVPPIEPVQAAVQPPVPEQPQATDEIKVTITQEILDMNPGMADEGVKIGDEVTFPAEGKVTLADAVDLAQQDCPNHTITVQDGKAFIVHNSTPPHLYEATGILKTLADSDGQVGLHYILVGLEEDIIEALLRIKNWIR